MTMGQYLKVLKQNSATVEFVSSENISQKKVVFRHTKADRIYYERAALKNVNKSSSGRRKIIPDPNMVLCKRMRNNGEGNCMGE